MKFIGITKRWLINCASIIFIILAVFSIAIFFIVKNYYYSAAELKLGSYSSEQLSNTLSLYGASSDGFEKASVDYIDSFVAKSSIGLWAINNDGSIIVTSSGFTINEIVEMPDFQIALTSKNNVGEWTGRLPSGEKIMARTIVYKYASGVIAGAVRYMVSLKGIDQQLMKITVMISIIALSMFFVIFFSSITFIRSIVNPVNKIGKTAKDIASGDMKARIDQYPYNDELGDLCNTINDMADKLCENDKMKNDFISTVSHELKTPLTAIGGWGETLLEIKDTDSDLVHKGLKIIINESQRLNEMVEELLDFSRINSGRMKLNTAKIDVLAELDEVCFSYRDKASKKGLDLKSLIPDESVMMIGDSSRIKQVFINVIENAIKYTETGLITVTSEINEENIIISVSDTGVGIAESDIPHIKEKFYKANYTVRGSGIGLAVCDEIVKLHKGSLDIHSKEGKGTTVLITLPIISGKIDTENEVNDINEQE